MVLAPRVRRVALAVHLTVSLGWIGAALAYLVLGVSAQGAGDPETVRAAWIGMEMVGWFAVVPLAVASLLTGLVIALGTRWGLFRHYWVLFSFTLTTLATALLVLHMPTVSQGAREARGATPSTLDELGGDVLHPAVGLVVLLVVLVLNVAKPKGLTRYGWRKKHEDGKQRPAVRS
jgi:hypothetical protein